MVAATANGWHLLFHPLFLEKYVALEASVERQRRKHPDTYQSSASAKRFNALTTLVSDTIPQDPKIIVFASLNAQDWANDEDTLRTYGAKSDAYAVFRGMLDRGRPPDDWETLLKEAKTLTATEDDA